MDLHHSLRYPFLKFISEEITGSFYENDLTYLNRMLILYHNRYIFSIYDDVKSYLDDYEKSLRKTSLKYWYLNRAKRRRIKIMQARVLLLLKSKREILQTLLGRKDYSSPEAKQQAIISIYNWLESIAANQDNHREVDIQHWRKDLTDQLGHLIGKDNNAAHLPAKELEKGASEPFYQILTGKDDAEKLKKFEKLTATLIDRQWISESPERGRYHYRKQLRGGRAQLAALYYCLNQKGHIEKELGAPQIATLFNSWLYHDFEFNSFSKIFQLEEQEGFHCKPHDSRYKYVASAREVLLQAGL